MELICQRDSLKKLEEAAQYKSQSLLLVGPSGSGKTFLAKQYSMLLGVSDFQVVKCDVQSIRDCIDECYELSQPVVVCIENIDGGQLSSSYTILKFLEEPMPNVYIVVTCTNIQKVPDTIISRSIVIQTSPPLIRDIEMIAKSRDSAKLEKARRSAVWKCVRSFKDAEYVMNMTDEQIRYFESMKDLLRFNDSVSNITWKLNHYSDNQDIPTQIVIQYIMTITDNVHIKRACIDCLNDLESSKIAEHSVLARFVFECKYCE